LVARVAQHEIYRGMSRLAPLPPFPAFAAPLVLIEAAPIARGFRYVVAPQGHPRITAYRLDRARETAARYSKRILEIGPREAFKRRIA
jgi:hypothetical protein